MPPLPQLRGLIGGLLLRPLIINPVRRDGRRRLLEIWADLEPVLYPFLQAASAGEKTEHRTHKHSADPRALPCGARQVNHLCANVFSTLHEAPYSIEVDLDNPRRITLCNNVSTVRECESDLYWTLVVSGDQSVSYATCSAASRAIHCRTMGAMVA